MRRAILAILSSAILMTVSAGAAAGFPEQPGDNVAKACDAALSNPGSGTGGAAGMHASPTALAKTNALVIDACFGGP